MAVGARHLPGHVLVLDEALGSNLLRCEDHGRVVEEVGGDAAHFTQA